MLLLLALLFAGLCCFMFWLRTGTYIPWDYDGYANLLNRSFSPAGSDQITLSNFLSSPIPVGEVPVHAIIIGLQFAAMSSIPILVAILYRLPFSFIFAAMITFLAAMPWLGITVMVGCVLAAIGSFKFTFRYASALIGLIPIVAYFVMASWIPATASKMIEHQALLYAPWVLALLGSCVICAVALAIARLINYRPGGIPPVLAMLFATPVFLFHSQVGRDELEYRLLESRIGPGDASFSATVHIGALAGELASRHWSQAEGSSYDEIYDRVLLEQEHRVLGQAEDNRQRAIRHCDAFIERFSQSRYVPNVLFLKARAQDCRVDRNRLKQDHRAEFRFDVPNRASRRTWQTLVERFPNSEIGATGLFRLAILKAREGDLDNAIRSLETLIDRFGRSRTATQPTPEKNENIVDSVFRRASPSSGLGIDVMQQVRDARRMREMIIACRNDSSRHFSSLFGKRQDGSDVLVHPVQLLMWFDHTDPNYVTNLKSLAEAFEDTKTSGFVEERLALMEPVIVRRIERLQSTTQALAGQASGAKAQFHLGDALQEYSRLAEARESFETLVKVYPTSCWSVEARERLDALSILQEATE